MQCHALKSSQLFRRCRRVQRKAFCYQHVSVGEEDFWRFHLKRAGLVPKINPDRKWAIVLDESCHAVVGYPEGKGSLTGLDVQTHIRWVLESDLYLYCQKQSEL